MKHRALVLSIVVMLAGCATVPARNIDRVQAGMDRDQVRSIMGQPETVYGWWTGVRFKQEVVGNLLKVVSWYDNEWGFAHQMVREALTMLGIEREI